MNKIKELKDVIREEDCVWCYVGNYTEEVNSKENKRLVIFYNKYLYVSIDDGNDYQYYLKHPDCVSLWKYATPCEELDKSPSWKDKYTEYETLDAKIFAALRDGAVLKKIFGDKINYFHSGWDNCELKICLNYKGNENDIWEELN